MSEYCLKQWVEIEDGVNILYGCPAAPTHTVLGDQGFYYARIANSAELPLWCEEHGVEVARQAQWQYGGVAARAAISTAAKTATTTTAPPTEAAQWDTLSDTDPQLDWETLQEA